MILDRQLPHGGWNYGNTLVFGRELHPMPENTGAALAGLAGQVEQGTVARSLHYLQGEVDRLCTPVSLGWALLGLAAWDLWPSNGMALVERCLANQSRYGEYDTSALCLLLLAALEGEADAKSTVCSRGRVAPSATRGSSLSEGYRVGSRRPKIDRRPHSARAASRRGGRPLLGSGLLLVPKRYFRMPQQAQTFVTKVAHYQLDIADAITRGILELGISPEELKGKRILLKPNLVETASGAPHINTHPLVLRGAIEAFLRSGSG